MISRDKLRENVDRTKSETKTALQTLYDALNHGQRKKVLKNPEVKERFTIDAWKDGAWQPAAEGTVIGHKRIVALAGIRTAALRIRILDARVAPTVRFIGVYA